MQMQTQLQVQFEAQNPIVCKNEERKTQYSSEDFNIL